MLAGTPWQTEVWRSGDEVGEIWRTEILVIGHWGGDRLRRVASGWADRFHSQQNITPHFTQFVIYIFQRGRSLLLMEWWCLYASWKVLILLSLFGEGRKASSSGWFQQSREPAWPTSVISCQPWHKYYTSITLLEGSIGKVFIYFIFGLSMYPS